MIEDLEQIITSTVREVFKTMLGLGIEPEARLAKLAGEQQIASSVSFGGTLTGIVYLYCGSSFAGRITSRLLGLDSQEDAAAEMVNDAMGEMANMVVGNLKSRLADRGFACALTIPSVFRGEEFSFSSVSSAHKRVFFFRSEERPLVVEVVMKAAT